VLNLEIGSGWFDSLFMSLDTQVAEMCSKVAADSHLAQGFNVVGYSMGALIARGYIQRCNQPKVINFVSWDGPHGGTYGIPAKNNSAWYWAMLDSAIVSTGVYSYLLQPFFSIAQFWRDPYALGDYLRWSYFLADINNERDIKNSTYRANFVSLNRLSLVRSTETQVLDQVIFPEESAWFGTFAPKSSAVLRMNETQLYQQDFIGLRQLVENRLVDFHTTPCSHGAYPDPQCEPFFYTHTLPYLTKPRPTNSTL
jgi:palmitoyl-protein thioesterase